MIKKNRTWKLFCFQFTTAIFAAVTLALSANAADVTTGLIARWDMSQMAGENAIKDMSGNERSLTFGSGCSLTNDVYGFKEALFFNGTSDAYASFSMPSIANGNMTWSCWLWRENADAPVKDGQQGQYLLAGTTRYGMGFQLRLDNSSVGSWTIYYGRDENNAWYSFRETDTAPRGCWTHFVFTFEMSPTQTEEWNGVDFNGTVTCYANGRELFSKAQVYRAISMPSSQTMTIGNASADGNGKRPLFGAISDFRVYNRALSATEVWELCEANASTRIYPNGQIEYFPMENIVSDPSKYGGTNYVANAASNGSKGADLLLHKITPYSGDDAPRGGAITFKTDVTDGSATKFSNALRLGDLTYSVWYKKGTPVPPNDKAPRFLVLNSVFYNIQVYDDYFYYQWPASSSAISGSRTSTPDWKHAVFTITNNWDSVAGRWKAFMRVYENGELMQTVDDIGGRDATGAIPSNCDIFIGNNGFINAVRGYEGEMDEIRLFDRALNDDEVRELYKTGSVSFKVEKSPMSMVVKDLTPMGLKSYDNGTLSEKAVIGKWHIVEGDPEKVVFSDNTSSQSSVTLLDKGTFKVQFGTCVGYGFVKSPVIELNGFPRGTVFFAR